jgi:hypothetical protein
MPPPTEPEIDAVLSNISSTLASTDFTCTSIVQLSGGTTSFVFRGYLARPFWNNTSAIIKYAAPFTSCNKDFPIDDARAEFEELILSDIHGGSVIKSGHDREYEEGEIEVRTPTLWYYNRPKRLLVFEDFPDTVTLKEALFTLDRVLTASTGRILGAWLKRFHEWTSAPGREYLTGIFVKNQEIRRLKQKITYSAFIPMLENFPEVLQPHRKTLELIQANIGNEFESPRAEVQGEDFGVIHGDFWAGNVLTASNSSTPSLVVIDWEFTQVSHRSVDLGQMLGDLYERHHYHHTSSTPCHCFSMISSFISGYGPVSEELAFRTVIHAGVHLVCWATRGAPGFWRTWRQEQVIEGMKTGVEWIVNGWERNRDWFDGTVLAGLFKRN